jgi:hypothetical protein
MLLFPSWSMVLDGCRPCRLSVKKKKSRQNTSSLSTSCHLNSCTKSTQISYTLHKQNQLPVPSLFRPWDIVSKMRHCLKEQWDTVSMHETMNETLSHYLIVSHKFETMSQSIKKRQIQERCVETEREQKSRPAYKLCRFWLPACFRNQHCRGAVIFN